MKKITIPLILAALLLTTACSSAHSESGTAGEPTSGAFNESEASPLSPQSPDNSETFQSGSDPVRLTKGLYTNYDKTPFQNASAKCYYARSYEISEEHILALFSGQPTAAPFGDSTIYTTENESERCIYDPPARFGFMMSYMTPSGNDFDTAAHRRFKEYSTDSELDFLSRAELEPAFKEAVGAFVPTGSELHAYSVTAEDYSNYVSENKDSLYDGLDAGEKTASAAQRNRTEPDDYYYIKAYQTVDNIPIFDGEVGNIDGIYNQGTIVSGVYTKNGIEWLRVYNPFQIEEEAPAEGEFISVDTAEQILINKYDELLSADVTLYSSVRLVYIPQFSENERLVLTPAWEFTNGEKLTTYINAFTGEEII